jgi:hypothetical protein
MMRILATIGIVLLLAVLVVALCYGLFFARLPGLSGSSMRLGPSATDSQNCDDQTRDCFAPPEEPSIVGPEYPRHGQRPSGHQ